MKFVSRKREEKYYLFILSISFERFKFTCEIQYSCQACVTKNLYGTDKSEASKQYHIWLKDLVDFVCRIHIDFHWTWIIMVFWSINCADGQMTNRSKVPLFMFNLSVLYNLISKIDLYGLIFTQPLLRT